MSEHSLKRQFDSGCAEEIARRLLPVLPSFDAEGFASAVDAQVGPLELKDRVFVLSTELRDRLPADYEEALGLLVAMLGPELAEGEGMFNTSWFLMPVARFIEEFGLDHPHASLEGIEEMTRRHTGEFAIRPYLARYPELTMTYVTRWADSPSLNVRRLASEGIRPRLPWAPKLQPFISNPLPVIDVLDRLIDDPSPYVRKSVANNLNDISRDHPDLAVDVARRWIAASPTERTRWIVNHGMRTLVKRGRPAALEVVGATADPSITVSDVQVQPEAVSIGEAFTITATVVNGSVDEREVIVDYCMHFLGRDGKHRQKVFKLARVTIEADTSAVVAKRHVMRQVSTRTYYPGIQMVTVQANGSSSDKAEVILIDDTEP